MTELLSETPFLFLGNQLSLDFVNTEIMRAGERVSLIHDYANLRAWQIASNAVETTALESAEARWDEAERETIVREALAFRKILRTMAEALATGGTIAAEVLENVNTILRESAGYAQVVAEGEGYRKQFHFIPKRPAQLLVPVAEAAADLLCHTAQMRVKKCENPNCILYFVDTSKNHARRWCSMSVCGNRMKAAAHYRRHRTTGNRSA